MIAVVPSTRPAERIHNISNALSAALGAYIGNKVIDDPEVEQLLHAYEKLETVIKQNFKIMEKNQAKYRDLYKRYGEIANCVAVLKAH